LPEVVTCHHLSHPAHKQDTSDSWRSIVNKVDCWASSESPEMAYSWVESRYLYAAPNSLLSHNGAGTLFDIHMKNWFYQQH